MTNTGLILLFYHLEKTRFHKIIFWWPIKYQKLWSFFVIPFTPGFEFLSWNLISSIIKLYWLNLTSFMTETGFLGKIYFSNIILHLLIIKPEMIHNKDECLIFIDLICLKENRCIFVDRKNFLFTHFESNYSQACIIWL